MRKLLDTHDEWVRGGKCGICGKPILTQAVLDEWNAIDWSERDDDETNFRSDLCWRTYSGECTDDDGNVIEYIVDHMIDRVRELEARLEACGLLGDESAYFGRDAVRGEKIGKIARGEMDMDAVRDILDTPAKEDQ